MHVLLPDLFLGSASSHRLADLSPLIRKAHREGKEKVWIYLVGELVQHELVGVTDEASKQFHTLATAR
eukprot:763545-Hanusia_phi.AAC.2